MAVEMMAVQKETRRNRFVRIAEKRVNRVLGDLESLGNCSNKKNYEYTETDTKRIFDEIEHRLREIKTLFQASGKSRRPFSLE